MLLNRGYFAETAQSAPQLPGGLRRVFFCRGLLLLSPEIKNLFFARGFPPMRFRREKKEGGRLCCPPVCLREDKEDSNNV